MVQAGGGGGGAWGMVKEIMCGRLEGMNINLRASNVEGGGVERNQTVLSH